jgi:hypothetical protein
MIMKTMIMMRMKMMMRMRMMRMKMMMIMVMIMMTRNNTKGTARDAANKQQASHITPECAGTNDEALGGRNNVEVYIWENAPPHQLQIEIDCIARQPVCVSVRG